MINIFGSGTMRTGGSLVCNIFQLSNENHVFNEIIYFKRHLFGKYKNFHSFINLYKLSHEFCLRLKYKNLIDVDPNKLLNILLKNQTKDVNDVYRSIIFFLCDFFKIKRKKNIIEYSNGEWKFIDEFLRINPDNKAFHVIRDPRAVISSFKKMTFEKGSNFWYSLFNWIDSYNELKYLKKKYSFKRFLDIKFENLHENPIKNINRILSFCKSKKIKKINLNLWKKKLIDANAYINFSSYDQKKKIGFSLNRIDNWKNFLKDYEICLIEHLLRRQMIDLGYKFSEYKNRKKLINKGLKVLLQNSILKKRLENYIKKRKGSDLRIKNPELPENWSSPSYPNKNFKKDKSYKLFMKEAKNLKEKIDFLKKKEIANV